MVTGLRGDEGAISGDEGTNSDDDGINSCDEGANSCDEGTNSDDDGEILGDEVFADVIRADDEGDSRRPMLRLRLPVT